MLAHRAFDDRDVVVVRESHDPARWSKFLPVPNAGTWSRFASWCVDFAGRSSSCARGVTAAIGTAAAGAANELAAGSSSSRGVATSVRRKADSIIATTSGVTASDNANG